MDINKRILEISKKYEPEIVRTRRELHRIPEPALREYETSRYIRKKLEEMGYETSRCAGTGVVGSFPPQSGRKTIAVRADIDALPIQELNDVDYKSQRPGMMHACGHDGHISMALGACRILTELRDEVHGNVKFIFQPAEEKFGGAGRMIEAGALKDPDVDAIIALHIWPDLEKGKLFTKGGCIMASNDRFTITVKGRGGHGAMPHLCRDALTAGCQIVNNAQVFVSREIDPFDSAVLTFGTFRSGTAYNVVSDETVICGTARAIRPRTRDLIEKRLSEIADHTCKALGLSCRTEYVRQFPPTLNDASLSRFSLAAAADLLGADRASVLEKPYMTAEDFALYSMEIPGCLCFLGAHEPGRDYPLHSEKFNFDEDILPVGAAFEASAVIRFLDQQGVETRDSALTVGKDRE